MKQNKFEGKRICHTADIQVRKAVRHDEYRQVFERFYKDVASEQPVRILLAGDIFHNKVDLSPNSIGLVAEFFTKLSHIAPVDIIPGNHDMNLSQMSQGDAIKSVVDLLFNGVIVTKENAEEIDFSKKYDSSNGIFYFPESGFYDIGEDIIYGNYSCIDGEILTLKKEDKIEGKKYIALFHGMVYESMNDNGTLNTDSSLLKTSAFDNFDMVMMGDIHEHQSFRADHSMAYASSILQNSYGESIKKGYCVWDLDKNSFRFKHILNDYGFAKIRLSPGENWEERLKDVQLSNDKKKTKVYVEWNDYEENYSLEKENQMVKFIKDHHGSTIVTVDFKTIFKNNKLNVSEQEIETIQEKDIKELILEWLNENSNNYDADDEFKKELNALSDKIDGELDIARIIDYSNTYWHINSMEVCNLFSYGEKSVYFDFKKLSGLTGIFGANYSGKTNFIKSMVWGLFQHVLGGGDSKKLVNIYTGNDKAYVNIYLNIGGVDYRILRSVRNYKGKDGEIKTTYEVSYQVLTENESKEKVWVDELNDKKTNDKKAIKDLIIDSIGTPQDFTKVNLQSETGKDNYLNTDQPGKNDIISKYLGLQPYQDRYDYAKKLFNEITKEQKRLGNVNDLQNEIKDFEDKLKIDTNNLESLEEEKKDKQVLIESLNTKIINLNSIIEKVETLKENDVDVAESKLETFRSDFKACKDEYVSVEEYLSNSFKKEIPEPINESKQTLIKTKEQKISEFEDLKNKITIGNEWLNNNPKKEEFDISVFETELFHHKEELMKLNSLLPSLRGEKCQTCGSVKKQAEPEMEKECLSKIQIEKNKIDEITNKINSEKAKKEHNLTFDKAVVRLDGIKNNIGFIENEIRELARKIDVLERSKDIIEHNLLIDEKQDRFKELRGLLENKKRLIDEYKDLISKIEINKEKEKKNKSVNLLIEQEKENIKNEKIFYQNIDRQTTNLYADIRVSQRGVDVLYGKLKTVQQQEREYKLYSIYLQSVHKDGIPSQIIKRKLPIINSKIRGILKDLVEYKVELWIDKKGDIKETFFYNEDKSDSLPMDSSSGAQGFLANLAIRDALHYVSKLPKSSMCIIDEGFGKLDSEITINMQQPLQYLKNKYRNVFVVTHKDIIKEFMDHVISISKDRNDIKEEYKEKYPHAWITKIDVN